MTPDFDRVRDAFATSIAGLVLNATASIVGAAWRTSVTGRAARSIGDRLHHTPAAQLIRSSAIAIAIAAGLQPLLIGAMPRAVAPAMPWPLLVLTAIFAAAAAWQAEAIALAWPASRLARWIRA